MKQHDRYQKNRRYNNPRGRNQNLAQRMMDSNGPDVKVRGNPSQICKKYQSLARDAQLAGNRVRAENYLQHADHYYRIVLAAQSQQQNHQQRQERENREGRENSENREEEGSTHTVSSNEEAAVTSDVASDVASEESEPR